MAEDEPKTGWEQILKGKFKAFDVEKSIYSENRNKANTPEMYAKFICDTLRDGDVPDDLKKMYHEAVYGTDPKVKARIRRRVYALGEKCRYISIIFKGHSVFLCFC